MKAAAAKASPPSRKPLVFTIPQKHQELPDIKIRLHEIDDDDDDYSDGSDSEGNPDKDREDGVKKDDEGGGGGGGRTENITHDVGHVMWPSSILLSRWLAENPDTVLNSKNKRIVELGAGCGLVGLTVAAMLHRQHHEQDQTFGEGNNDTTSSFSSSSMAAAPSSSSVVLTDYLPKVISNLRMNLELNGLSEFGSAAGLDFFDQPGNHGDDDYGSNGMFGGGYFGLHHDTQSQKEEVAEAEHQPQQQNNVADTESSSGSNEDDDEAPKDGWFDMTGRRHPQVDLVLAADILCYSNDATMVANTLQSALVEGGQAVLVSGDESIRFGAASFPDACRRAGLNMCLVQKFPHPTSEIGTDDTDIDPQNLQADLIMFTVEKPIAVR